MYVDLYVYRHFKHETEGNTGLYLARGNARTQRLFQQVLAQPDDYKGIKTSM